MMKIRHEATEVPPCTFSDRARQNSLIFLWFLYSSIWLLFAQVMASEANGTNYDGYIRYKP